MAISHVKDYRNGEEMMQFSQVFTFDDLLSTYAIFRVAYEGND
jgi:hypothetical protein